MKAKYLWVVVVVLVSSSVFLGTLVFRSRARTDHKPYQDQPLVSPSGKYVLTVPIEIGPYNYSYWRLTISDVNGNVLFKDDSDFMARFNVYWSWDNQDRVWLENSDNGNTYYWELGEQNQWRKFQCRYEKEQQSSSAGTSPELLPCTLSPLKQPPD